MGTQVVEVTWNRREVVDPTVYTGLLGTAFTCLRSYEVTGCQKDLLLCSEIIDACATVARDSLRSLTFPCLSEERNIFVIRFFLCCVIILLKIILIYFQKKILILIF